MKLARIVPRRISHCFCELPKLPPGHSFLIAPRLHFRAEVKKYAKRHGLRIVAWGKYKQATVIQPVSCAHRKEQTWALEVDYILAEPVCDSEWCIGWGIDPETGEVVRCDTCCQFPSDEAVAEHVARYRKKLPRHARSIHDAEAAETLEVEMAGGRWRMSA